MDCFASLAMTVLAVRARMMLSLVKRRKSNGGIAIRAAMLTCC
jgi:hypothetical protein